MSETTIKQKMICLEMGKSPDFKANEKHLPLIVNVYKRFLVTQVGRELSAVRCV